MTYFAFARKRVGSPTTNEGTALVYRERQPIILPVHICPSCLTHTGHPICCGNIHSNCISIFSTGSPFLTSHHGVAVASHCICWLQPPRFK